MASLPKWLGPLVLLEDSAGDPVLYIERLYEVFVRDFVSSKPQFKGKDILIDAVTEGGKPRTFNHITTEEDGTTKQRILSIRRCERIGWIRAIIENADDPTVLVWEKEQQTKNRLAVRTYMFLEQDNFLLVLEELKHGNYLITAIYIDNPNQRRKHLRAYEAYKKLPIGL